MNTDIKGDFQICVSLSLKLYAFLKISVRKQLVFMWRNTEAYLEPSQVILKVGSLKSFRKFPGKRQH